jgi:phosphopantetheinyl transferase
MQQRKRRKAHRYTVYVAVYATQEVKDAVERNTEDFTQPDRVRAEVFYSDYSQALAERAFARAALSAMNNPLAFEVVMTRDGQTIIRVKAQRF